MRLVFLIFWGIVLTNSAYGVARVSQVNGGNWNTAGTWNPAGIPTASDDLTISAGHTINVSSAAVARNVTFNNGGTINFTANVTLNISGDITTVGTTSAFTGNNILQTVNLTGNFTVIASHTHSMGGVSFNMTTAANTMTINGTLSFTSATGVKSLAKVAVTSTGIMTNTAVTSIFVQSLTMTDGSLIDGTASLTINDTGTFSVVGGTFGNKSSLGNCVLTVSGSSSIGGYLYFSSATGLKTFSGTITVAAGATWDNTNAATCVVNCSIVSSGNWTNPSGGTAPYLVNTSGQTYTYTTNGGSTIILGSLTINGTSTVTNLGSLNLNSATTALTVQGGGRFNNGDGVKTPSLLLTACTTCVSVTGSTVDFSPSLNTVYYNSIGVTQNVYNTTYYNLFAANSTIAQLAGNTSVTNLIQISETATLNDGTGFTLNGAANLTMTGTSTLTYTKNTATLPEMTGATNSLASTTNITFDGTGTSTLKSSATYPYQTINVTNGTLNFSNVSNVAVDVNLNGGVMSNNAVLTVGGTFTHNSAFRTTTLTNSLTTANFSLESGTLNYSSQTITINGTNGIWNFASVIFPSAFTTNATSTVIFTSGANQQITSTIAGLPIGTVTTFQNLTINNPNGLTLSQVSANVAGTLTLTSGVVTTGTNTLAMTAAASIVSRTAGYVDGNFQKVIATGAPTVNFEIGDGGVYSPVSLVFTGVSASGSVTTTVTVPDHPSIASSPLNPSKSVNRYWSITNNATTFTSYNATFTFVAGDVDGGANTANFQTYRYNGTTWFATTAGARTATTTQFTGELAANLPNGSLQNFAIGEVIATTNIFNAVLVGNWSNQATWIQNRTGTITIVNGSNLITGVGTSFLTELAVNDFLMLQTNPAIASPVRVQSITDNTHLVLTANATATQAGSGAYGRQYVPNTINDIVTIGNTNNAGTTTITLDINATVNTLNVNQAAAPLAFATTLTHSGTNSLTVQSNVTVNQPNASTTDVWNINAGSATVGGNVTLGSAVSNTARISRINITTGTLTTGGLVFNTANAASMELTAVLNMVGSTGQVNLSGATQFTNTRGLLLGGTSGSNFNYNGTTAQVMALPTGNQAANVWAFNNVLINNTAGVTYSGSASGSLDITASNLTGDFRLQSGKFTLTGTGVTIAGNGGTTTFQLVNGTTFRMTGNAGLPTGFTTYAMQTTSTVDYSNSANITLLSAPATARAYGNILFNSPGIFATFTFPNAAFTATNMTIGDGVSNLVEIVQGTTATTLTLTGNFTVLGDVLWTPANFASVTLAGNWLNNSLFNITTGTTIFNGTGTQTFTGVAGDGFTNMTVNTGAANTVQLQSDLTISNILTLTQGGLDLNGHTLNVTNGATGAIARTSGYIKSETTASPYSPVVWTIGATTGSHVFPFGKSSAVYIPFTYNVTTAGSAGSGTGTVKVVTYGTGTPNTPYPSTVTNLNGSSNGASVGDRFWIITPDYANSNPVVSMTFVLDNTEVSTVVPGTPLNAQRWSPAGYWDAALVAPITQTWTANTPAANVSQLLVTNVSNALSAWALASTAAPLPIELTDFNLVNKSGYIEINWRTETELNNDYFTLERSNDGESFTAIATLKGAGTKLTPSTYRTEDYQAHTGVNYYRLRQTDFHGEYTLSAIKAITFQSPAHFTMYPNPSGGQQQMFQFSGDDSSKFVEVRFADMSGHVLFTAQGVIGPDGKLIVTPNEALSPGLYLVTVALNNSLSVQKLVVR